MASLEYKPGQLLPGTVYRVVRLIGVGGMGTVYDVEDTTIGKRYVVKTLHPKLGARDDLARRVLKEARTLARLNHPNIIDVITAGVTGDDAKLPYYVMERLNGQSLRMILDKRGRLELGHAYHIGIDLLDALDHAHDKGLIHRDVKPDNIFLHRPPGGVTVTKLLDFGIVSVLDGGLGETAGRFLGTLRYAAPEQLRGEVPTPKMDVYAAALVLYETLAGRGPFDDQGDAAAVGAAHVNKLAPRVSTHVPVPRELDNLLTAALAKDPRLRPRDAFSFAASLRNLSKSLEASERRDPTGTRTTVAGVIGPVTESAPTVPLVGATPSPAPVSSQPVPSPRDQPNATLVGMAAPTLALGVARTPEGVGSTTSPEPLDRMASTRSADTQVARPPKEGTEAIDAQWTDPLEPRPADDGATVPCAPPSDAHALADDPIAAMLAGLAAVGLSMRAGARRSDPVIAEPGARPAPKPVEQEIVPAPMLPVPAFDLGELPGPKPRDAPASSASASLPVKVAPVLPAARPPAPSAHAEERPGPGF